MDYTSNPTAKEADELTAVLNEERYARTLANIARRAENLWDDGYRIEETAALSFTTCYTIRTPRGDAYQIHIEAAPVVFGDSCDCPSFTKYGTCKHMLAVQWKLRDEAQAAAWEAAMENAEGEFGCDAHAEF